MPAQRDTDTEGNLGLITTKGSCVTDYLNTHTNFFFFFLMRTFSVSGTQTNTLHWTTFSCCVQVPLVTQLTQLEEHHKCWATTEESPKEYRDM